MDWGAGGGLVGEPGWIPEPIIKSFHSLWIAGHPWRAAKHCGLQLCPWPRCVIFLCLSHPVLPLRHFLFGLFLLLYPWGFLSNAVSLLLLFLYVIRVPSNSISLFYIWLSIDFWWVILHSSSFINLSVHFIFIICLKHLFTNICSLLVNWLALFKLSQAYNSTDFTFVVNIRILTSFVMLINSLCHLFIFWLTQ